MATRDRDADCYQRHRSEQTLFYLTVDEYFLALVAHLAEQGSGLLAIATRVRGLPQLHLPGDSIAISHSCARVKKAYILPIPCSGAQ
jgi:hypothetical protein